MHCLLQKYAKVKPKYEDMVLDEPIQLIKPIIYDKINTELIRKCATKMKGASGPSGLEADFWRKIAGSNIYGNVTDYLCHAIALTGRQLCSKNLADPESTFNVMQAYAP